MARRIVAVRGKRAVIGDANIFVRGYRCGFRFSARIGEQPTGKSSGEAARHYAASRASGLRWRCGSSGGPRIFSGLGRLGFLFYSRGSRSGDGLAAIFREGLTGEQDRFFSGVKIRSGRGGTALARCLRAAIFKAALSAWLETAGLSATILALGTLVIATRIPAGVVALRTLRRSIFRRRQIASATWSAGACTTATAAAATETATTTVAAGILPAIVATAEILARPTGAAR